MPDIRPITIHLHNSHYASYALLDVRTIRHILGCMVDYLLLSERGFEGLCNVQDVLLSHPPAVAEKQQSEAMPENGCAPFIRIAGSCTDSIPLAAQRTPTLGAKTFSTIFPGELNLIFVRDGAMYTANKEYMDCASPTNILSFPLYTSPKEGVLVSPLGDMLLSVDTVRREAFMYGQEPSEYAISLLAHGMAHMAGFDHGESMSALEQALLACFLVPS